MGFAKQEKIKEVMELRQSGKTFRQIAQAMPADIKSVYRWYQWGAGIVKEGKNGRPRKSG